MADGYGVSVKNRSGKSSRDEELQEDVWSVVKDREDSSPKMRKSRDQYASGSSSAWRSSPAAPRVIPRANSGSHEACRIVQQSSAPVNIPDWSKIYRKNAKKDMARSIVSKCGQISCPFWSLSSSEEGNKDIAAFLAD
ncbi:hypothetical protein F0562_018878 [Nyssa sinensis]|uniref:Uncharacterized protein n=1 Tax=Nyssa sinensis TaxID=561372 RepID=A0A5J4ZDX8_9ASTE|nr:hypothetical protein F0562_018878 [Nyssa sinensis]